jgi:hypothetical protein
MVVVSHGEVLEGVDEDPQGEAGLGQQGLCLWNLRHRTPEQPSTKHNNYQWSIQEWDLRYYSLTAEMCANICKQNYCQFLQKGSRISANLYITLVRMLANFRTTLR